MQVINDRGLVRTQDGHRVVIVSGVVLAHYALGDRMAEAHARVSLVEQGWGDQNDVAHAFDCSARTVRRDQRRFEDGGLAALGQPWGYPEGRARLAASRRRTVHQLKAQGHSHGAIARRLGVSEMAIRKLLRRMGWKESVPEPNLLPLDAGQTSNPKLSAFASAAPAAPPVLPAPMAVPKLSAFCSTAKESPVLSQDTDPSDRCADRLLARLGLLADAPPLFGSVPAVPRAGVLLALPVLVSSGIFECAKTIYGSLDPAFYGLRTSLLTLLLMALGRIKRPEGLKVTLTYVLADQEVRLLKGQLRLRQVTRLMDNGHQTPILTSRRDLPPPRWRIGYLIAGDRRTSSNTCARNTRWMR